MKIRLVRQINFGLLSASSIRQPVTARHVIQRGAKTSIVDWKPIRSQNSSAKPRSGRLGRTIYMGLLILMPVVSFGLGTWQVQRLKWKTGLITQAEYRLSLPPLPLPPRLNPEIADKEFDYRRVSAEGKFRHDQEMFVGPRMHDGKEGYLLITPLERTDGSKLLICRGWISKQSKDINRRGKDSDEQVIVECLLRTKPKKNYFTPEHNDPSMYHFLDIDEMARITDSQPILLQATVQSDEDHDLFAGQLINRGVPIGAPAKVDIRNTHFQYILTWYGLSALTTAMLIALLRQNRSSASALAKKLAHARKNQ
jgi:surfeit locus 1 family protein